MPELRLGGLDVEFKENCRIEGAGIAEGSKKILLGERLTAVGKTLFREIEVDWVTVLYRGADMDRANPPPRSDVGKVQKQQRTVSHSAHNGQDTLGTPVPTYAAWNSHRNVLGHQS